MGLEKKSRLIIFVAVLASLLEIIDTSIVNVAIPTMMGSLGATLEDISMVITGYAIANAIILPLSAWLGARFGRRRYYLGCILAFTATSVACGFAPNLTTLIIFRIFQGLAGGALLPTSQTLIYEQFPKEKAGIAGALFGMSVMIGPTLGPVLGGYLTDNFGWRMIFNINIPLGILAFFVGFIVIFDVESDREYGQGNVDFIGLGLLTASIGCLQFMLEQGESKDWFSSAAITTCAAVAAIGFPMFIWWELRVKNPIVNIRLFTDPIVQNGVLLMSAVGFFLYGIVFMLPIFVVRTLGFDATQTGALFIPGSVLTAMLMPFVGRSMQKIDPRRLIAVGFTALVVCMLVMARFSTLTDRSHIMTALYIRGIGMAFLFVPINSSILSQFKGMALGQVSGLMNLMRQIGGSIGIAMVGTMLTTRSQQNFVDLASHVSLLEPQTQLQLAQIQAGMAGKMIESVGSATPSQAAIRAIYGRVQAQAFQMSFSQLMYIMAFTVALAFIPLVRLKLRYRPGAPVAAH